MRIIRLAVLIVASLPIAAGAQDSLNVQETRGLSSIRQTRQAVERAFGNSATFAETEQGRRGLFTVNVVPRDTINNLNATPMKAAYLKKAIGGMMRVSRLRCTPPGDTLVIRVWRQDAVVEHQLAHPLFAATVPFSTLADTLLTAEKLRSSVVVDSLIATVDGAIANPQ